VRAATGLECELIKGSGGVFDVIADGTKIYSKHDTGVFPEHAEIISQLQPD